jgi:hypothetical protein
VPTGSSGAKCITVTIYTYRVQFTSGPSQPLIAKTKKLPKTAIFSPPLPPNLYAVCIIYWWRIDPNADYGQLNDISRHRVNVARIAENWDDCLRAGEMFLTGSLSYDRFWDRLPSEAANPAAIAAYAASQGWGEGADGFIGTLQESLKRQEGFIERALSEGKEGYLRCGKDGRPIVTAIQALPIPVSAIELEKQLKEHMPERQLLEAIRLASRTPCWTPQGAHLLLQVRVHVLNDELGAAFQRWYPKLGSGPEAQLAA